MFFSVALTTKSFVLFINYDNKRKQAEAEVVPSSGLVEVEVGVEVEVVVEVRVDVR